MKCPACERTNPDDARYCIYCSARLAPESAAVQEVAPATGPTTRLPQESMPNYTMPASAPAPAPTAPAAAPAMRHVLPHSKEASGAIFLIGLGVLFLTGNFFPGILVLLGVTGFISESGRGHQRNALSSLIFFCGLAFLFWSGSFFPGILILIGLMALINARKGFC